MQGRPLEWTTDAHKGILELRIISGIAYFQEEKELRGYCVSYCNHAAYALYYTCNDARGLHPYLRVVNF